MGSWFSSGYYVPTLEDIESYETYVFDCDGVIWGIKDEDSKTAVAMINHLLGLGKRAMFVTNNSNKRRAEFVAELERRGVDFKGLSMEEKIGMMISASYTTAKYLKDQNLHKPFVITSDVGLLEELRMVGITEYFATIDESGQTAKEFVPAAMKGAEPSIGQIIRDHPNIDSVVVGWDLALTARKVATAVNYIKWYEDLHREHPEDHPDFREIPIVACSGDAGGVLGAEDFQNKSMKVRAIGNGAMADFIGRCFDPPREWVDMGKPSDELLRLLTSPEGYGVDRNTALMVGDTLQTDIVFGNRGGMHTLLVLTGVTTQKELDHSLQKGDSMRAPTYVLPQLGKFVADGRIGGVSGNA
mmetsp:Transcript_42893/g.98408  ORF Transcript_42893/g.98408 Transcript_42893/m.98408 type:complete len:357 (+) Transcript_42893:97-1167(+)